MNRADPATTELKSRHAVLSRLLTAVDLIWDDVTAYYGPTIERDVESLIKNCNQPALSGRIQATKEFLSLPAALRKEMREVEAELSEKTDSDDGDPLL